MPHTSFSDGDIVVRSSDGFELHLHQVFLSLASPYFRGVISNREKECETIPTVSVVETASTIDFLLQFVYPNHIKRQPEALHEAVTVYCAAKRLEIEPALPIILGHLSQYLEKEPNPLRAWATAVKLGLNDQKSEACRRLLVCHLSEFNRCIRESPSELKEVSGLQLLRLLSWYLSESRSVLPRSMRAWLPGMLTEDPNSTSKTKPLPITFPIQPSSETKYLSHPDGDVILSSIDDVEFCFHAVVLSHSSATLKQGIDATASTGGVKRIAIDESAVTINILARFMYPTARPAHIPTFDDLVAALRAAQHFQIDIAIISLMEQMEKALGALENTLQAWAIARRAGEEYAKIQTTLRTLKTREDSLKRHISECPAELAHVTGLDVSRLLSWRLTSREEAYELIIGGFVNHRGYPIRYRIERITEMFQTNPESVEEYIGSDPWDWAASSYTFEGQKQVENLQRRYKLRYHFERLRVERELETDYQRIQELICAASGEL